MSADNWRECPVCKANENLLVEEIEALKNELYGVVSKDDYAELDSVLLAEKQRLTSDLANTLREDYEIELEDHNGVVSFVVYYSCYCTDCRFSFERSGTVEEFELPRKKFRPQTETLKRFESFKKKVSKAKNSN